MVVCGVTATPYTNAPSQDALCGTAVEAGKGFWVQSKLLQLLQEVKPLASRSYACISVDRPGEIISDVGAKGGSHLEVIWEQCG